MEKTRIFINFERVLILRQDIGQVCITNSEIQKKSYK